MGKPNKLQLMSSLVEYREGALYWADTGAPADGTVNNRGYRVVRRTLPDVGRVTVLAHRLTWFLLKGSLQDSEMLDHINTNRLDNRIENLRTISASGNMQNRRARGTKYHKPYGKWYAVIALNHKRKHLGYYDSEELAHQAYLNAKRELHEFASETVLK